MKSNSLRLWVTGLLRNGMHLTLALAAALKLGRGSRWQMARQVFAACRAQEWPGLLFVSFLTLVDSMHLSYLHNLLPSQVWVRLQGTKFLIGVGRTELGGFLEVWVNREYEQHQLFQPSSGWTVVDAGANVGFFSIRHALKGARVLAVEPNAKARARLAASVAVNGLLDRVIILPCALGEFSGTGWLTTESSISTTMGSVSSSPDMTAPPCDVRMLDDVLAELEVDNVDLLKMDVEGAEAAILSGGRASLPIIKRVVLEYHSPRLIQIVRETLHSSGFTEVLADENHAYFVRSALLTLHGV